ncbi:tyrosine-type recombinase/integrase [Nocardiopsis sp. NPDC057823]|uniref:tyrosine-type recombinase/integrase n=1 Tax=Nocardiopsis sp. NPDC057823 TaxID=3346256 RepID=UPI00366F5BE3
MTQPRKTEFHLLIDSWARWLRADVNSAGEPKSDFTIRNYTSTIRRLGDHLAAEGLVGEEPGATGLIEVAAVTRQDIAGWLGKLRRESSANNANHHHRNLTAFYQWAIHEEELLHKNPMNSVKAFPPGQVDRTPYRADQIKAILKASDRPGFLPRRDHAILRMFLDTGVRVGGLVAMRYDPDFPRADNPGKNDVFLDEPVPLVRLRMKGGRVIFVDIGSKTAVALDRYLRERAKAPGAGLPNLWLSRDGLSALGTRGVRALVRRRTDDAGYPELRSHPHKWRRTVAVDHLRNEISDRTIMRRLGWKSSTMIDLYASEAADALAWEESQKHRIADRY